MIDISVVIPTFRRPDLLREAITSALTQERVSVEIIVVDDSPEGSALDVVDRYADSRVTCLRAQPPSGGRPALVRNRGWQNARGRFIHFLDDDDCAVAGFYRAAVDAFEAYPDRGVVFGRIEPFGSDSDAMKHERAFFADAARRARFAARIRSRRWIAASLLFSNTMLVNSACIVRNECVAAVGGYDSQIGLNEDVDFFCRVIRRFDFTFLDQIVVHYRIMADSLMHGRVNDEKLVASYQRMYTRYREAHGGAELFAMKILSQTLLRVL